MNIERDFGFARKLFFLISLVAAAGCFWQSSAGTTRFETDHDSFLTLVNSNSELTESGASHELFAKTENERLYEPVAQPIETIRVGQRVWIDESPDGERDLRFGEEVVQSQWRKVSLRCPKKSGGTVSVEMLRPIEWFQEQQIAVGQWVDVHMQEIGIDGLSEVLSVSPCPPIAPGFGRTVTATFRHTEVNTIDVLVEGQEEPIGSTPNHPFWNETIGKFVRADQLQTGDKVKGLKGELAVKSVSSRKGTEPVFNLEVNVNHVYRVGAAGILVHNAKYPGKVGLDANSLIRAIEKGETAALDAAIAGRQIVVSRQVIKEFLVKGDKKALASFLNARGAQIGAVGTQAEVDGIRLLAKGMGRSVKLKDARVGVSVHKDGIPLITRDKSFRNFLNATGIGGETF